MTSVFSFLLSVTLSNMFSELNMNPRYIIFCEVKKVLVSGYIKSIKRRNIFIVLILSVRHSSYVCPNVIRSSMYIAIMIPSNLKTVIGSFVTFEFS